MAKVTSLGDKKGQDTDWNYDVSMLFKDKPKSVEEFKARVLAYFTDCQDKGRPPVKPGLALALGYASQDSLRGAMGKLDESDERGHVYKKATQMMEQMLADKVLEKNAVGSMFMLKASHNYRDNSNLDNKKEDRGIVALNILGNSDSTNGREDTAKPQKVGNLVIPKG